MSDRRSAVRADVSTSSSTMKGSCVAVVMLFLSLCGLIYGLFWIRAFYYVTRDAKGKAMTTAATATIEAVGQECHNEKRETEFPKIIHQIWWNQDKEIPAKYKRCIESCREKNPRYQYRLWNMKEVEQLIRKEYSWFAPTFTGYEFPMQRGDAARYVILHKHGGFYLDLDITCTVPMETILSQVNTSGIHTLAGEAPPPVVVDTPIIISKKREPFMKYCMHKLVAMDHAYFFPFLTIYFSTGPYYLTLAYMQYPCKDQIHIFDVDDFRAGYFLHDQSSSWHSWDGLLIPIFSLPNVTIMFVVLIIWYLRKLCALGRHKIIIQKMFLVNLSLKKI